MASIIPLLTTTRQSITPYLPPPLVSAIRSIDAQFDTEASMIMLLSILVGLIGFQIVSVSSNKITDIYHANRDDDDIMNLTSKSKRGGDNFSHTVLICGPSGSGKTVLFHSLCDSTTAASTPEDASFDGGTIMTVKSLKAAEGILYHPKNDEVDKAEAEKIRIIDFPGHGALRSSGAIPRANRIMLVLDSSKSVSEGAKILYSLLTGKETFDAWKKNPSKKLPILVICNKADLSLAKNSKRIKLQFRTELERMRKLHLGGNLNDDGAMALNESGIGDENSIPLGVEGKSLDLDTCDDLPCLISFLSVSLIKQKGGEEHIGMKAIQEFACGNKANT